MINDTAAAAEQAANDTSTAVEAQTRALFADSAIWLQTHWLEILIAGGIGTAIFLILHLMRRWAMKLCARTEGPAGWGTILGRAVARTGHFFIIIVSAKLVAGYANPPVMLGRTVDFLFTLAAVFQAAIWAREIILGAIEKKTESENYHGEALLSALGLIRLLVTFALFAIALVVVLDNLGVNVTGLVAGLGVGGIAIGLAAQGIFADLFAALAIIFDKPFRRGDKVQYDQTIGVIEAIGLKSTRIRAFTGEERIISNKQLLDKEIWNVSNRDHVRIELNVGIAYETPPDVMAQVPAMLREIVEAEDVEVARSSFEKFGASSIDLKLLFDVPGDDWPTAHAVRDRVIVGIVRRFGDEGIGIPFPIQVNYTVDAQGRMIDPWPPVVREPDGNVQKSG